MFAIERPCHTNPLERQAAWILLRYLLGVPESQADLRELLEERNFQRWLFGTTASRSSPRRLLDRCQTLLHHLEDEFAARPFYSPAVASVGERLGLDEVERRILWVAVLHAETTGLRNSMASLATDVGNRSEAAHMIARMIDAPISMVARAIGPFGRLVDTGLLEMRSHFVGFDDYVTISERLSMTMIEPVNPDGVFAGFLQPAGPSSLGSDDFPHMIEVMEQVMRYLKAALRHRSVGVNILLHGLPGTGKTEFASVLASRLQVPLYVVPEDTDTPNTRSRSRLSAYRMTQALLSQASALVLFDDVEDGTLEIERSTWNARVPGKALINTLLEANPVPAIWITNVAERFEPAHLRRFDLIVGFRPPPRSVRLGMIQKHLGSLPLSSDFTSALADDRQLTPAQVGKLARVVSLVSLDEGSTTTNLDTLGQHLYQGAYKLRFGRDPEPTSKPSISGDFALEWLHCEPSARQIEQLFRASQGLTACFHGVSGTGKTALAQHLAHVIDKPLLIRQASDLLRPFIGETEMLMRQMFEEAMDERAILLLDEADSFLGDRKGAQRVWEVTQVNELLTQIERYRGHFIATTNAFDVLDEASLRRFDLKARFHPSTLAQRMAMTEALLQNLGLTPEPAALKAALAHLSQLTPGDVAVVARRLRLRTTDLDAATVIEALCEEHRYKDRHSRPMGFNAKVVGA